MDTINYITFDAWWDTDVEVLKDLTKHYKVNVFVMGSPSRSKFFICEELHICNFYRYVQKYRTKDIRNIWENIRYYCYLRKYIKQKDIHNIFIPWGNPLLLFLLGISLNKSNTIIFVHNFIEHLDALYFRILNYVKQLFYKRFHFFCFFSEMQKRKFQDIYSLKDVHLIPMPLKDYGQPKKNRINSEITFLFFGYIRDYKRPDYFIKAANSVSSNNVRFIIAGSASDADARRYTKLIENSKIECHFELIDTKEISNYFNEADFLVLPYEEITQSGPSLIAINYCVPIIASDLPGFRKIVQHGYNGFLFKKDDINELITIFNNIATFSQEDINKMKQNQKAFKNKYNEEVCISVVLSEIIKKM